MHFPVDLKYSKDHLWVKVESDGHRIGITDYAQDALGDVVYVELPQVGTRINRGEPFGVVESVKAVSDLIAPLSGNVVEINGELPDNPQWLNEEPYGKGWLIRIDGVDSSELNELMDAEGYRSLVAEIKK